MTFISPEDGQPTILLFQPETPFLIGMRAIDAAQEMQARWWQAWMDIWGEAIPGRSSKPDEKAEPGTPA
jgi:hypothetical protein